MQLPLSVRCTSLGFTNSLHVLIALMNAIVVGDRGDNQPGQQGGGRGRGAWGGVPPIPGNNNQGGQPPQEAPQNDPPQFGRGGGQGRPQISAGSSNQPARGQFHNQGTTWGGQRQDQGPHYRPNTASGGRGFSGGDQGFQGGNEFRGNQRRGQTNRGRGDYQQRQNRGRGFQNQSMNVGDHPDGNQQFQNAGQFSRTPMDSGPSQFQSDSFTQEPRSVVSGNQENERQPSVSAWEPPKSTTQEIAHGPQGQANQPDVAQQGRGRGRGKKGKADQSRQQAGPSQQQTGSPRETPQAATSGAQFETPPGASGTQQGSSSQTQSMEKGDVEGVRELGRMLSRSTIQSGIDLIRRPDKGGIVGRPVRLLTNHFELRIRDDMECYHYDIEISPKMSADKKREVFNQFVDEKLRLGDQRDGFVFDGQKNIYSCIKLAQMPPKDCQMEYVTIESGKKSDVKVTIQFAAYVDLSQIMQYMKNQHDIEKPQQALNVLNTAYKHMCHGNADFITLKRATFSQKFGRTFDLGGGLDLWFGYQPSIIMGRWKVYLQLDVTSKGFTQEMELLDFIDQFLNERGQRFDPNYPLNPGQLRDLSKALSGYKIKANHTGFVKKVVDFKENSYKMLKDTDPPQNVGQYFMSKYNYNIRFPKLPLVRVHPKDKDICIPAELCTIRGKQPALKKLDERQQSILVKETAMNPSRRNQMIMDVLKRGTNPNNQKVFRQFNLQVNDSQMSQVNGRVLPGPIIFGNNNTSSKAQGGKYDDRRITFFRPATELRGYVVASPNRLRDKIGPFHSAMGRQANKQGVNWPQNEPQHFSFDDRDMRSVENAFHQIERRYQQSKDFNLVVIFLFQKNPDVYAMAKHVFDNLLKLPSQVALQRTISGRAPNDPPNPMFIKQLLLKINTKLAGINFATLNDCMGVIQRENNYGDRLRETVNKYTDIFRRPFMVFGADVTHPDPGDHGKPSIAAVVGSLNSTLTRYGAQVMVQASREEMIIGLKEIFMKLLKEFRRINKDRIPEKILYYRDGVSEGRFSEVLISELRDLQSACKDLNPGFTPQITFIVVNKSHKARFFQRGIDEKTRQEGIVNIEPGWFFKNIFGIKRLP